jgi:hypothetical protein
MKFTKCTSPFSPHIFLVVEASLQTSLLNVSRQARCRAIVLLGLLPVAACVASKPNGGGGGQQQILVTVSPSPVSLGVSTPAAASQQQFTAVVTGPSNTAVTWNLSAGSGCALGTGAALGSMSVSGNTMTYTAPTQIPASPCPVVVTALSSADMATTGQALVNVHVTVTINGPPGNLTAPPPAMMGVGANWQYTATVNGSANQLVSWEPLPPNQGSIDAGTGLYIAPLEVPIPPNATIFATSAADPTQFGQATITVQATDPVGAATPSTASAAGIPCPAFTAGVTGGTCYQIQTSCDGVADFTAYLKVNTPAGTPTGTVIFGTDGGGSSLYDNSSPDFFSGAANGGLSVVQGVLDLGFTTVQVSFGSPFSSATPNGWLTGPGGVRRLACRYATVADWVYNNIHNANAAAPMCATGNNGGAGAIAYALNEYGLDPHFAMVDASGGPTMSRLDEACVQPSACQTGTFQCNSDPEQTLGLCYSTAESPIIDPAYAQPQLCTNAVRGGTPPAGLLFSDSILGVPARSFPKTYVNLLMGGSDTTSAVEQSILWGQEITTASAPAPTPHGCRSDATNAIPAVSDGANQIVTDIQQHCALQ